MAAKNTTDDDDAEPAGAAPAAPRKGSRKLIVIGLAAIVLLGGAGIAYATGVVEKIAGGEKPAATAAAVPGAVDLPEIISNLNAGARRTSFIRLKARLVLANKADQATVLTQLPKVQDLFQTYLRDMRPEELRGSAGTYRLREELMARANIAVAPAQVTEILFIELLVQ